MQYTISLIVAVRRNPLSRNATKTEVEQITKNFLRNAFDREGGRGRRGRQIDNEKDDD